MENKEWKMEKKEISANPLWWYLWYKTPASLLKAIKDRGIANLIRAKLLVSFLRKKFLHIYS